MGMLTGGLIGTPAIVFIVSLAVAGAIYALGSFIAPKPRSTRRDKYRPYACGQEVPAERLPVVVWLFKFATAFMVVDVAAFLFILSMGIHLLSPLRELLLIYGTLLIIALIALLRR